MRVQRPALLLVAWAGLLCACHSVPFPKVREVPGDLDRAAYVRPAVAATTEHRWVIESRGMEGVFTLYVRVRPPATLQMAALNDMGGTMCAAILEDGVVSVKRSSRMFPDEFIERILSDLRPFLLPAPPDAYTPVQLEGGMRGLYRKDGDIEELHLRGGEVRVGEKGRTAAAITVQKWKDNRPASYRIEGFSGRYHATADVARQGLRAAVRSSYLVRLRAG